jgi:ribosomal RNA-processing protein 12
MPPGDTTTTAHPVDFETALNNIRRLSHSSLAHQKKPAQLLIALEETLSTSLPDVQSPPYSGTAYFASLVQCLEAACAPGSKDVDDYSEAGLIPATLYLMAVVVPETPRQVVTNQLTGLLPTLIPLFDPSLAHPPALRSLVQIFTTIFLLSPVPLLNASPLLKRAWNHFLELNVDPRPKVRHLAQEGVRKVLTTPIPPRVIPGAHPYLARARDWAMAVLQQETKAGASAGRPKKVKFAGGTILAGAEDAEGKRAIWVVQGLRGWVSVMNEEVSPQSLPSRTGNV